MSYNPVHTIVPWIKWGVNDGHLPIVYISLSFSLNNVKKVFFTLCLNKFTLFDGLTSSGKQFQIKDPINTTNISDLKL